MINTSPIKKQISPGLYLLESGDLLCLKSQKIIKNNYTWLLTENVGSCQSSAGLIRKIDQVSQLEHIPPRTKAALPVYCLRIYKRLKTTYAELIDRNHTFEYPINGKRLIKNAWVDFKFRMYPNSAYLLMVMYQEGWPQEMYIVKHMKIEKS